MPAMIVYEFGSFVLEARRRLLVSRSTRQVIPLPATAVQALFYLVDHAGEVVTKEALLQAVWPDVNVEENSLAQCISTLRRAFGERPSDCRFIATVPGRGYRFIANVVATESRSEPSIAVLPFKPLGDADIHDALQLGMSEALIRKIGSLRRVNVKPLSSVGRYGGLQQDPADAGRELGADIVVDGSVQRHGDRLRIAVRLVDVASGHQLWSDRFDGEFTDIFVIQDTIAERAAGALIEELSMADRRALRRHPTEDAGAYQAYVVGWAALTRPGSQNLETALRSLQDAIARDPGFALAHTRLAHCYTLLGIFDVLSPCDVLPKALEATRRALELDPELAEAHAQRVHVEVMCGNFEDAEHGFRRALEINPRLSVAHHWMGLVRLSNGQIEEALASVQRAQELEPLALILSANIGMIYYYARRYEDAVAQLQATLEMDASFDHARSYLGRTYLRMGDIDRALEEFLRRTNTTIGSAADVAAAHALAGRRDEALIELHRLLDVARERYVSPYDVTTVYVALGDTRAALDWLERTWALPFVDLDPALDALREQPEFRPIVDRVMTRIRTFGHMRPGERARVLREMRLSTVE
jgi:serine/threonine-protein kinase